METAEAILAIRSNWPDERYTMLREALTKAIAALEEVEAGRTATNSRYVAALALYEEYLTVTSFGADTTFKLWCKERLNAAKAPHCT